MGGAGGLQPHFRPSPPLLCVRDLVFFPSTGFFLLIEFFFLLYRGVGLLMTPDGDRLFLRGSLPPLCPPYLSAGPHC